jgi:beta-lactamase superfamily II metal-dependent hydrolase
LGEKWALIDCNLPQGPVRQEFFRFISSLGINRLDLVCLTHPHDDHYTGMHDVLRYFTSNGRSVGTFCHGGTDPPQIHTLLKRRNRPESSIREYERLYRLVDELIDDGLRLVSADENTTDVLVAGQSNEVQLLPIGPRAEIAWRAVRDTISSGRIRTDLNRLSVVLALTVRSTAAAFDALLAADTDAQGFRSAMDGLKQKLQSQAEPSFDVVKVAHHGSLESHRGSEVCAHRKNNSESVAAISTGAFDVLPDREVLREFLEHDWSVLLTTKRYSKRRHYPLELSGKTSATTLTQTTNIKLVWTEKEGLFWEPLESKISATDLENYQTAT